MPEGWYNIHDRVWIRLRGPQGQFAKLDKEYAYYRAAAPANREPDIDFDLNDFTPPRFPAAQTVDKKYLVGDDAIYAADRYKVAFWKVWIEGLAQGTTRVRFRGNRFSMIIVVKLFLEPLIRLKFTLAGMPMIHSSCLSDGERGFVLAASPSTGKTTTLLNWLAAGHPFVSDEYTILAADRAWGYVTPFRFHAHNLEMNPILQGLPEDAKRQIRLRTALLKASGGYADVTYNIGIRAALPQVPVSESTPWTGLFVITRADVERPVARPADREDILTKLQVINFYELRQFAHYLKAYAYVHPRGDLACFFELEREHFRRVLADRPCHEINVPAAYGKQTYEQLLELLYSLV
ncbi:MAG: hypothetical protein GX444_02655 [Myxococcales bacterium]|nr:hypothetical protein [Myxococcales bacterium]